MATIVNTKLAEHKGRKRIWVEGTKLQREGIEPGQRYSLQVKGSQVHLNVSEDGKYKVSKRTRNGRTTPIIDLTAKELAELFDGVETLRVAIKQGVIVISAHHQHDRILKRVDSLLSKVAEGKPLDVCSLFHGGGCLDRAIHQGLKDKGISSRIAVAVEMEGKYLDSSLQNNPQMWDENSVAIESPIQDVCLDRGAPSVDIVMGGIPCTGASRAGRSKNKLEYAESHEAAGAMFFNFLEFVKVLNPAICIIENVVEYQGTSSMVVIRSLLSSLGYQFQETILDGNEMGVLEKRKRLCLVAFSKGLEHLDLDQVLPVREKEPTLGSILEDIPMESPRWKKFEYLAQKQERDAAGKGFTRQLLDSSSDKCGTIGKGYAKCRSTEPFLVNEMDPSLSRILTPAEHCRVKGIPEEVIQGLSDTIAHEILGQSVIFPAFQAVGRHIGEALNQNAGLSHQGHSHIVAA